MNLGPEESRCESSPCRPHVWLTSQASAVIDLEEPAKAPLGGKRSYGSDPLQFGEMTMPEGPGPYPVVSNIYGGCWLAVRKEIPDASDIYQDNPIAVTGVVARAQAPELDALHEKQICGNVVDKLMGGAPGAMPERYRSAMLSAMSPIGVRQIIPVGKLDEGWRWVGEVYAEKVRAVGDTQIEFIEAPEPAISRSSIRARPPGHLVFKAARELLSVK